MRIQDSTVFSEIDVYGGRIIDLRASQLLIKVMHRCHGVCQDLWMISTLETRGMTFGKYLWPFSKGRNEFSKWNTNQFLTFSYFHFQLIFAVAPVVNLSVVPIRMTVKFLKKNSVLECISGDPVDQEDSWCWHELAAGVVHVTINRNNIPMKSH